MSYGEYIFTLGKDNPRTYKGSRMKILDCMAFAAKVVTTLAKVLTAPINGVVLDGVSLNNLDAKYIAIMLQCLSELDSDVYMDFFRTVTNKTVIEARVSGGQVKYLTSENEINDWFSKYPEDLFPFSFKVIMENVTPFLPEEKLKAIKEVMVGLAKIQLE